MRTTSQTAKPVLSTENINTVDDALKQAFRRVADYQGKCIVVQTETGGEIAKRFNVSKMRDEVFVGGAWKPVVGSIAAPSTPTPSPNVIEGDGATLFTVPITATNFISTVAVGTQPFACTSTTLNTNLNADQVDSLHAQSLTATGPITLSAATKILAAAGITIAHDTAAGYVHLPTAGSANQILKNSGVSGTGAWGTVTENAGALGAITTLSMSGQLTNALAIGTAPLVITSTTLVSNLNADLWDGYQFTDYLNQAVKTTSSPIFAALTLGTGTVLNAGSYLADTLLDCMCNNNTGRGAFKIQFHELGTAAAPTAGAFIDYDSLLNRLYFGGITNAGAFVDGMYIDRDTGKAIFLSDLDITGYAFTATTGNFGTLNSTVGGTLVANKCNIKHATLDPYTGLNAEANFVLPLKYNAATNNKGTGIAFSVTTSATNVGAAIVFKRTDSNCKGQLEFYTKQVTTDATAPVLVMTLGADGQITLATAANLVLPTSTGVKIGTATNQLLAFYGVTPVDQPVTVADPTDLATCITSISAVIDRLIELGLIAAA